jgi:phosphoribosyl 1,2-cyclic phosphate phosphodiesterase
MVINALRHEKHVSHFNLEEALEIIERVKPEKAYLTHISHQLGREVDVNALLPNHVRCAHDGMLIEI